MEKPDVESIRKYMKRFPVGDRVATTRSLQQPHQPYQSHQPQLQPTRERPRGAPRSNARRFTIVVR